MEDELEVTGSAMALSEDGAPGEIEGAGDAEEVAEALDEDGDEIVGEDELD